MLTTGRSLYHYHTGTITRRVSALEQQQSANEVQISPETAAKNDIKNGELVKLVTRRGSIELKAKITDTVRDNACFPYFHFAETPANLLTSGEDLEPVAGIPSYKVLAARLEKIKTRQ